ncbi:MAG: NUDIX domain-containing protein [Planctomycetota bacterium]|nr:NUDIX domain-containing protein [Planctomycetota bacterium]
MPSPPIPTWHFAIAVVRKGDRFLLVHETKHGQCWYLPAGKVELGETYAQAARREAMEEAGVPIRLTGILRIEQTPLPDAARLRVVFLAEPVDDRPPKSVADEESLGAKWVSLDELHRLELRGPEVEWLIRYVLDGKPVHALDVLQTVERR